MNFVMKQALGGKFEPFYPGYDECEPAGGSASPGAFIPLQHDYFDVPHLQEVTRH